jgi:transaldolase
MTVSDNPLLQLRELGQSPWCDQPSREMLESGQLARMVRQQAITGLTSNPQLLGGLRAKTEVLRSGASA